MANKIIFPEDLSDLEGSEELRCEYIKSLIEVTGEDARHVTLNVTVALAIVALLLTQLPEKLIFGQPLILRAMMIAGLLVLPLAGAAYFRYVRAVHLARMGIVRCLASADASHARQLWAGADGVWARKKKWYLIGKWAIIVGVALEALAITFVFVCGA